MADPAIRLYKVITQFASEGECQRHLYLSWSADGVGYIAKAGRAVIEAFVGLITLGVASSGQSGPADGRELVKILILKNLVARDVEAGGVG